MIVTFIRHGESTDNIMNLWAGWKDAPLSDYGFAQSRALGLEWKTTPVTIVYTSDLLRSVGTAEELVAYRAKDDPVKVVPTALLREQHFGEVEGKYWELRPGQVAPPEEMWTYIPARDEKFPGGESLQDLADRMDKSIDEYIMPYVNDIIKNGGDDDKINVVIVGHGLSIWEMITALLARSPTPPSDVPYKGIANTGWTQVKITIGNKAPPHESEREVKNISVVLVNGCPHLKGLRRKKAVGPNGTEGEESGESDHGTGSSVY